jgi:hypothetical protein
MGDEKMKYVNLTPRWTEILPTWWMILNDAITVKKPDQIERFTAEIERMAQGADNYNDLLTFLRRVEIDWTDSKIAYALQRGRALNERERNTVRETSDAL